MEYTVRKSPRAAIVGNTLRKKAKRREKIRNILDFMFTAFMVFVISIIAAATIFMCGYLIFSDWDKPVEQVPNYEEKIQNAPFSFSSYEEYENYMYGVNGR